MKQSWRVILSLVVLWSAGVVKADDEKPVSNAPAAAQHLMPKGALSLQSQTFKMPSGEVLLHLYTIPTGHSTEREAMLNEKRTGPVLREHISTGPSLLPSRFWLDVFAKNGDTLKRLNSVPFIEDKDAQEIKMRWLQPAKKQGPVVLMHFGFTHWHEWIVVAFPQGFSGNSTVQEFFFGGEGETGVMQKFDQTDSAGRLIVKEEEYEEGRTTKTTYVWDGVEFKDAKTPYFVIGATCKTKAEAEAWIGKTKQGFARPSSHYSKLKPGYWVVVLNRFATMKEATKMASEYQKQKIDAYAKRAF